MTRMGWKADVEVMIEAALAAKLHVTEERDVLLAQELLHVFAEELQHILSRGNVKVIDGEDGLDEVVLLLGKLRVRCPHPQHVTLDLYPVSVEDSDELLAPQTLCEIDAARSKVADRVSIIADPEGAVVLLQEDFDLVAVAVPKKRRDHDTAGDL